VQQQLLWQLFFFDGDGDEAAEHAEAESLPALLNGLLTGHGTQKLQ
jgi:hypothetical protein